MMRTMLRRLARVSVCTDVLVAAHSQPWSDQKHSQRGGMSGFTMSRSHRA